MVGTRGAYRLAGSIESVRVPATVQTVLAARIDRLASDDKRLLQTAAVIGKDLPFAAAHRRGPEADLHASLARLVSAELLYSIRLFLRWPFKRLTHDVAYGSLLQERRRALRPDRRGDRAALRRPPGRARRAAGRARSEPSCGSRRRRTGGRPGVKADGRAACSEAVAAFERTLVALVRLPGDGRDA